MVLTFNILTILAFIVLFFFGRQLGRHLSLIFALLMSGLLLIIYYLFYKFEGLIEIYLAGIFMLNCCFYMMIYKARNLILSISSFILFSINFLLLFLQLLGCYYVFFRTDTPLYIENISTLSQYRYILFTILGLVFCLFFLFIEKEKSTFFKFVTTPFLFKETTKILSTWENEIFGPVFNYLYPLFIKKTIKRDIIIICHTILYYIIPFFVTSVFAYLVFFHKDLQNIVILAPLSLISYIYRHIFFYFLNFADVNITSLKDYITLKIDSNSNMSLINDIISIDSSNIRFELTPRAFAELPSDGDSQLLAQDLADDYLILSRFQAFIIIYQRSMLCVSYLNISLRYLTWFFISLYFLGLYNEIWVVNLLTLLMPKNIITRPYSTAAYNIKKNFH